MMTVLNEIEWNKWGKGTSRQDGTGRKAAANLGLCPSYRERNEEERFVGKTLAPCHRVVGDGHSICLARMPRAVGSFYAGGK